MSNEEILKANKSICDFMGLPTMINSRGYLIIKPETGLEFDYVNYHLSWDKLMCVVDRIETELMTTVVILKDKCQITKFNEKSIPEFAKTVEANSKIKATWLCVVEYVNWHNKTVSQ